MVFVLSISFAWCSVVCTSVRIDIDSYRAHGVDFIDVPAGKTAEIWGYPQNFNLGEWHAKKPVVEVRIPSSYNRGHSGCKWSAEAVKVADSYKDPAITFPDFFNTWYVSKIILLGTFHWSLAIEIRYHHIVHYVSLHQVADGGRSDELCSHALLGIHATRESALDAASVRTLDDNKYIFVRRSWDVRDRWLTMGNVSSAIETVMSSTGALGVLSANCRQFVRRLLEVLEVTHARNLRALDSVLGSMLARGKRVDCRRHGAMQLGSVEEAASVSDATTNRNAYFDILYEELKADEES